MTGAVIGVLVLLTMGLGIAVLHLLSKSHAPRQLAETDTGNEIVAGLSGELRKWQAEAAHWKATAERLQRELDGRQ